MSSYKTLDTYNTEGISKTPKNYQSAYVKPKKISEKFGAFSISAAVRPPYNEGRYNQCYKYPKTAGVS